MLSPYIITPWWPLSGPAQIILELKLVALLERCLFVYQYLTFMVLIFLFLKFKILNFFFQS